MSPVVNTNLKLMKSFGVFLLLAPLWLSAQIINDSPFIPGVASLAYAYTALPTDNPLSLFINPAQITNFNGHSSLSMAFTPGRIRIHWINESFYLNPAAVVFGKRLETHPTVAWAIGYFRKRC